jgi:diguanylate cyclase (GGDEF)-like protein/PAS domain S-box-containing protein
MEETCGVPLSSFVDLLLDAICVVDAKGRFVFASAACEHIFGYTPAEMLGKVTFDLVYPEDRAKTRQAAKEVMSGQLQTLFENRYVRKDGRIVHIMWSARWSEAHQVRVAVARDITMRKHAESMQAALYRISEAAHAADDLHTLLANIHQIIGQLLPARNLFVALYDEATDQLSFPYHVDEFDPAPEPRALNANTLSAEVIRSGEMLLLTPETLAARAETQYIDVSQRSRYWLGVPLNSRKGTIGALVVQIYSGGTCYSPEDQELLQFVSTQVADAIERQQMHARLQFLAQHDPLTHLPNRQLLTDRLKTALARAHREQGSLAVLYLDLDKFKEVNDTFGHTTGDLLLQVVAQRLTHCVREADTVARVGGDEFVVLLHSITLPQHAWRVAEKIRRALNQPFDLMGHSKSVLPSIGVALYPEHGHAEQQLLKQADAAMYLAKNNGGNQARLALAEPVNQVP